MSVIMAGDRFEQRRVQVQFEHECRKRRLRALDPPGLGIGFAWWLALAFTLLVVGMAYALWRAWHA